MSSFLYLHGFNSSPQSIKAVTFKQWLQQRDDPIELITPALSYAPTVAVQQMEQIIANHDIQGIVGSSLGGYYATWLSQRYQLAAVVINPAVRPFELLSGYLGTNRNIYTGEEYDFKQEHADFLRDLYQEQLLHPEKIWLLQQQGDELLDYRDAVDYYVNCKQTVEQGGDHSFVGFERYFPTILSFLADTSVI